MEWLRTDPGRPDESTIDRAAEILAAGGVVVLPTETVYGLAGRADLPRATRRIRRLKSRDPGKPLPIQVASTGRAEEICRIPERVRPLLDRFWPGPLTVVLQSREGDGTVGVRIPDHPVALAILDRVGRPLAVPSANRAGDPPPRDAKAASTALGGAVDAVVDAGPVPGGIASTVLDLSGARPRLLRAGPVSVRELEEILGAGIIGPIDRA